MKRIFRNQFGVEATLEFSNGWYILTVGDRVSQSRDLESSMRILAVNGYVEL